MVPIDFRNATFRDIQSRLSGLRASVYEALLDRGPCTTRQLSQVDGLDLLTIRPRITELVQLGLVECLETRGHEGIYSALTQAQAEAVFLRAHQAAQDPQLAFAL
jgi:predicted transcriptional regulator